jgi:hypothetical protein
MTYDLIEKAVRDAGYFATRDCDADRVICAALKRLDGGLTGNSFWVAKRSTGWFLGTWGPTFYLIPNPELAAELCTSWLSRQPSKTAYDVDDHIRREFHLVELDPEELPEE